MTGRVLVALLFRGASSRNGTGMAASTEAPSKLTVHRPERSDLESSGPSCAACSPGSSLTARRTSRPACGGGPQHPTSAVSLSNRRSDRLGHPAGRDGIGGRIMRVFVRSPRRPVLPPPAFACPCASGPSPCRARADRRREWRRQRGKTVTERLAVAAGQVVRRVEDGDRNAARHQQLAARGSPDHLRCRSPFWHAHAPS
jgi:hypothetical protein